LAWALVGLPIGVFALLVLAKVPSGESENQMF